jgi:sugar phosphate isomerase/epimerase
LKLELDLAWVRVAGHDPVAWINKYAGKIAAVHVKDIAPDGTCLDEDGWADVGHGIMDWAAIHSALQGAGITHYVAEHDNPNDDKRFATRSLAAIQQF